MKIKQAAARCGLTEKAIRLYEEKGLISPPMTEINGRMFRDYDEETVSRLQTISALRRAFFSIDQIAEILDHPENIPAVFASYREELHNNYTALKPLLEHAEEIDPTALTSAAAVSEDRRDLGNQAGSLYLSAVNSTECVKRVHAFLQAESG